MSEQIKGTFMALANTFACGQAKKTKTHGVAVMFEITAGEHKGAHVGWSGWLSEAAAERTIEALETMGWKGDDPTAIVVERDLTNPVEIVVELEPWESEDGTRSGTRSIVRWVNRVGGAQLAPMAAGDKAAFQQTMRGLVAGLRAKRAAGGAPAKPAGREEGPIL